MYTTYNTVKLIFLLSVITLCLAYKIALHGQASNVLLSKRLIGLGLILFVLFVYEALSVTNPHRLALGSPVQSFKLSSNAFKFTLIYQTVGIGK